MRIEYVSRVAGSSDKYSAFDYFVLRQVYVSGSAARAASRFVSINGKGRGRICFDSGIEERRSEVLGCPADVLMNARILRAAMSS